MTGTIDTAIEVIHGGFMLRRKQKRALTSPRENVELGHRLQEIRKQKGISQTELAERLKITQRAVSYYEKGTVRIPAPLLLNIGEALDLSIPELLGSKPVPPSGDRKIVRLIRNVEKLPPKKQRRIAEYIELISKV